MNPYTFYQSDVRNPDELIIGSSDIPVIIKTKSSRIKKTPYELWEEKTGRVEPFKGNESTAWGHDLEPLLISAFIRKKYNHTIAYRFKIDYILHEEWRPSDYHPSTFFHPFTECKHVSHENFIAHADCLKKDNDFPFLIEAKTGAYFTRIKREGVEGFSLEDHTINGVPTDIILQVQWQMLCYNVDFTYVLLLVDDNKFHIYEVPAIKKWWPVMLEKADRFRWHCENDRPPKPESFKDIEKFFPDLMDRAIYVTGERAIIAEKMKQEKKSLQSKIKKYQDRINDINNATGLLMGNNKYLYNGETGQKIFQQIIIENQYNPVHPSAIKKQAPEVFEILEKKGLINKSNRRWIK